jgi:putative hydrolase of the HAD superfamily
VAGVRAVLLDLYDTLVWSEWPELRALIERRSGVSGPRLLDAFDRTRSARSTGTYGSMEGDLDVVLEAAGIGPDAALLEDLAGLITGFLERGVHLWEDSLPVMRELRSRGLRTAIVSNCDHGTRPVVGVAKPDAGIYRNALDAVGAATDEAVFVDDQTIYCDGAAALGIEAFLLIREDGNAPEPGGHRVIHDLRSLLDLV